MKIYLMFLLTMLLIRVWKDQRQTFDNLEVVIRVLFICMIILGYYFIVIL